VALLADTVLHSRRTIARLIWPARINVQFSCWRKLTHAFCTYHAPKENTFLMRIFMTVALACLCGVWRMHWLHAQHSPPTKECPRQQCPARFSNQQLGSSRSCKEDSRKQRHSKPRYHVHLRASPHGRHRTLPCPCCKAGQLTGDSWLHSCSFGCKHDTVWISEDRLQRLCDAMHPRHVGAAGGATD
jgi:hypothetical protein